MADVEVVRDVGKQEVMQLPRKAVLVRTGAVVATVAGIGLATPLIASAVVGGAGLAVLGVFAVVGIGVVQALPLMGQKWENKLLQARKAEARENPIEQRQNSLLVRQGNLGKYKEALGIIGGNIATMRRKLEEQKRAKPNADYSRAERQLKSMEEFFKGEAKKLENATHQMELLKERIEEEAFEYQFAQDGQKALAGLKGATGPDPLRDLLDSEASNAIAKDFDTVFATVELDAILAQAKQLRESQTPSNQLDSIEAEFNSVTREGGKV